MERKADIDRLRLKLLGILIAFALIPLASVWFISMMEMNQATEDVQSKILNLSTTLNRSALLVAPDDADQVQYAIAKASLYNEFFNRIKAENEFIANYASTKRQNENCSMPAGMWVAPIGSNRTSSEERTETIRSLCAPAMMLRSIIKTEPSLSLSYIGTEDGVLVTWPYSYETLANTVPFDYRDKPYYAAAKTKNKTIWTGPYIDAKGLPTIIITTPIYRNQEFSGVAGMDVSMESVFKDLSSIRGRGYPFIIDRSGKIIMRPAAKPEGSLKNLFESDNLSEVKGPEAAKLKQNMLQSIAGSSVIGFGETDGYVAYAPIISLGWSFGIAYPAEEMSLPARFIDSGIKEVARSTTQGLNDAYERTKDFAFLIFAITGSIAIAIGLLLSRRIDGQISSMIDASEKISHGDFNLEVKSSGELASLGLAFNKMARDLKDYIARIKGDAEERGRHGKEAEFLRSEKQRLVPGNMPHAEGYEISVFYLPSEKKGFDIYDAMEVGDKIALVMAGVSGDGLHAAMLALMSRALIRGSPDKSDPLQTVAGLNSQINQHAQGINLACFYALLDPFNHNLDYVNAGFNPPFIVDRNGMVDTLGGGGIALGMLDRMDLRRERIPIQLGDVLVIYSNSVTEVLDNWKKEFGTERLISVVINNRTLTASEILGTIEKELADFSRNHPIETDITLLILKRS